MIIRPAARDDFDQWLPLWLGYCAFYDRTPADNVTTTTWQRFFDHYEPVHCLVAADQGGCLVGITHYLYHRNTGMIGPVCYLQDLFTAPDARGQGVGRALIQAVYSAASAAGAERVYWQTQHSNAAAMRLYDTVATRLAVHVYRYELDQ
jgi:GNAT superfamily N-acetyltransferase